VPEHGLASALTGTDEGVVGPAPKPEDGVFAYIATRRRVEADMLVADVKQASRGLVVSLKDHVVEMFGGSQNLLAKCLRQTLNQEGAYWVKATLVGFLSCLRVKM